MMLPMRKDGITIATLFAIAKVFGRQDPCARPRHPVPHENAEALPVMRLADAMLSTDAAAPPMRDFEGQMVEIRMREPTGLHLLTATMVNAGAGDSKPLPPPPAPLLTLHDKATL